MNCEQTTGPTRPIASPCAAELSINGPRVVGATPGRPFLFLIPATGEGPFSFSARNLPAGLSLDPLTGIVSGVLQDAGATRATLTVRNSAGETARSLTIIGGERRLALTPPMGWNSWNCWGTAVSDEKVRLAADWMVRSGLAAHGYQYINIDDAWEGERDSNGILHPNEKFPDMKDLADYVHSKGLKLGIYSSPGPKTCAGYEGSYRHDDEDANSYAQWGIDYLKYDYCSYLDIQKEASIEEFRKPYARMRQALDGCGRDIVYSLCWGGGSCWRWGPEVGGNLWRTSDDMFDNWNSMSTIGFAQDRLAKFSGPGYWNDPDMLVVGQVGWGPSLHPTGLTPDEQITHITLWSMLAAPLLIGCDLSQLDDFTLALLTNDEVLAVDQDPLGKQGTRRWAEGDIEVWARPLLDSAMAVALFNRSAGEREISVEWAQLGIGGGQPVRDLWQRRSPGIFRDGYSAAVPPHGAIMLRIGG